jgi:hypothetical protein
LFFYKALSTRCDKNTQKKGEKKMTVQTVKVFSTAEKFHNVEQLWFWFLYSRQVRNGFSQKNISSNKHVCELLDVETLITKLYLSGSLNDEQLNVMKEFGDKRRSPHQHIWSENQKAAIWRTAMQTLEIAAKNKGWVD